MTNLSGLFNLKLGASLPTKQQVKDYVNTTCKYPGHQQYRHGSKETVVFEYPTNPNQLLGHKNPGVYMLESMPQVGKVEHSFILVQNNADNTSGDYLVTSDGKTIKAKLNIGDKRVFIEDKNNNGKIDVDEVTYTDKSGLCFEYFTNEKLPDSMSFLW